MPQEHSPTITIDTREQNPLDIQAYPVERGTLPVGDYGISGFSDWDNPRFIVERKSLDDLVGSLTSGRDRFMRECEKLRQFTFAALLIEGFEGEAELGQYHSKAHPNSIMASLAALQVRANIHVMWCRDHEGAARMFERLVRQFIRGIEKDVKRLENGSATHEE